MPARHLQADGLVLGASPSGERHTRLHVLSAGEGRLVCLWRRSAKNAGGGPDLFDQAAFQLESPASSSSWFVQDYQLGRRRGGIARRYRALQRAARLGDLLWRNLQHAEFFEPAFRLASEALDAFDLVPLPEVIYLKAVYRFAGEEGYPARQQWAVSLPRGERDRARDILHRPLGELDAGHEAPAAALTEKLERWLRSETDIIVP